MDNDNQKKEEQLSGLGWTGSNYDSSKSDAKLKKGCLWILFILLIFLITIFLIPAFKQKSRYVVRQRYSQVMPQKQMSPFSKATNIIFTRLVI